ncbi:MAG: hypothetical protein KF873_12670 [Gemmataceae bacterium]|nr:hypothetical protein [Planctomycetia bacterium]MBX3399589.1 hypothetical protein [Gemmataceae bacterium]
MASVRCPAWFVVAAALTALPACNVARFFCAPPPSPPPAPATVSTESRALAPGQRIPKAEVVVVAPSAPSPPMEPAIAPPPPAPAKSGDPMPNPLLEPTIRGPRPDTPLVAALRAHLDNQFATAVGHLKGFERPNQELLLLLLPILDAARHTDLTGRDPRAASLLIKQLESAQEVAAKSAPLEITQAEFVHRVVQYGVFDPLPAGHRFLPGGVGVLYAEIDRVPVLPATQTNGEHRFVTRLDGTIQLRDANGRTVELYDPEKNRMVPELPFARADFTRSPVRDFFLKVEFPIPEKPGRYSLTLEIRDPTAQTERRARKVVEFQVGP